jgi:arylsulfatase A-like enzyme
MKTMYKIVIGFFCFLLIQAAGYAQEIKKPNLILIVADDLGYSDLGSYGGEISTPTLDQLAQQGLRLSNMNNAGMCVITRSSMLTGQWWPRVGQGIEKGTNVAQELKKQGYRTGLVGKWHLDGEPNDKGYDYFFGFLGGFSSYFTGSKDYRLNKEPFTDFGPEFYSTDALTSRAIDFISLESKAAAGQPFFLYLSYQAPHNPLQAPKADIMKYRGRYLKGWEAIRKARIANQIKFGIVAPGASLPDYPQNLPDWESLSPAQKDLEDLRMSVYAAMVERMDGGIGKLMEALEASGVKDNTFILFLSDNGTDSFSKLDAGMLQRGLLPGDAGSNFQPGTGWGYATVAPWRLYKISQHGGGIKTGAIAWWPNQLKNSGMVVKEPMHVVDIMPTFLQLAGAGVNHDPQKDTLAGKSFVPLLEGKSWSRKSPMYFQYMDNRAIRTEQWSLVEVDGSGWELYDTKQDPYETNDLSKKYPRLVKKLDQQWLNWWKTEGNTDLYVPNSTATGPHYAPQGDRGTGKTYVPSAMPEELSHKYKKPTN